MEISVYYNSKAPLFKRVVMCPDTLDIKAFVACMKSIFGEKVIIDIIIV